MLQISEKHDEVISSNLFVFMKHSHCVKSQAVIHFSFHVN